MSSWNRSAATPLKVGDVIQWPYEVRESRWREALRRWGIIRSERKTEMRETTITKVYESDGR